MDSNSEQAGEETPSAKRSSDGRLVRTAEPFPCLTEGRLPRPGRSAGRGGPFRSRVESGPRDPDGSCKAQPAITVLTEYGREGRNVGEVDGLQLPLLLTDSRLHAADKERMLGDPHPIFGESRTDAVRVESPHRICAESGSSPGRSYIPA